jgi:hypothetical protein
MDNDGKSSAYGEKGKGFLGIFILMVLVTIVSAFVIAVYVPGDAMMKLKLAISYSLLVLIFLFGFVILAAIASGKIDITELLEEETGGASTSRFQLLIFTFVIGLSFALVVASSSKFPDMPTNVLALLGVSASTYGVSKGIQAGASNGSTGTATTPAKGGAVTDPAKVDQTGNIQRG